MATGKKHKHLTKKDMRFSNDPMIRLYDTTQDWLQEHGRPVVIAIGVLVGIILLYGAGSYLFGIRKEKAERAYAEALEVYQAPVLGAVTDAPPPGKYYTDENTKWQEAAAAFERVANDYSGYYGPVAGYYAGLANLHLDRNRGIQQLQEVAGRNKQPAADQAKLALAEAAMAAGEADNAITIYEGLLNSAYLPKQGIQYALGHAYEKAGNKEKAVEMYFQVADADRANGAGSEAERRLAALAPSRVKDLRAPAQLPMGLQ